MLIEHYPLRDFNRLWASSVNAAQKKIPLPGRKTVKSEFSDGKREETENFHKGLHVSVIAGDSDEEEILVASQSTESKETATESKKTAFSVMELDDAREDAEEEDDEEPDNFDRDLDKFRQRT